jgi:hypothetical protein
VAIIGLSETGQNIRLSALNAVKKFERLIPMVLELALLHGGISVKNAGN